jgi:two-component system CheB/CheR fusion protein
MQSANEELQSTNEELESSREELQSLNEELNTVNSELQVKIRELDDSYQAVTDALDSTQIAIVFLDKDLRVVRFTKAVTRLINLIDSDVGRPLEHFSDNLDVESLSEKAARVLKSLTPFESEVKTEDGHWYRMNIMVHRREEHIIEGVVLTFANIDAQKRAQQEIEAMKSREAQSARRFAESIVNTVGEALLVLDEQMRVVTANRRFIDHFGMDPEQTEGKSLFELGNGQWNIPELRRLLEETAEQRKAFEDYPVEHRFTKIGLRKMLLNGRHLREEDPTQNKILLAIEDVTDRR